MALLGAFILPHPPLIISEIGKGEEEGVKSTIESYHKAAKRIGQLKPDTIIITTPHSIMYSDYIHISPGAGAKGDFRQYGAKEVSFDVAYDEEFVEALENGANTEGISSGTQGEKNPSLDHGSMVPLYFINQYIKDYKVVRMGLSGLPVTDHYNMGKLITRTAGKLERRIVLVASGDLSHKLKEDGPYGFAQEGVQFDQEVTEAMERADFQRFMEFPTDFSEKAAECGLRSFVIMAGALDGKKVKTDFMSYEGPFGVGYAVSAYEPVSKENQYLGLARNSIETYVKTGRMASIPDDLPDELLNKKAGVFVTLYKNGELRGCIGTISPVTDNLAHEILRNSISAAMEDPRFPPVTEEELPLLVYSVDVLGEPEEIKSLNDLDVNRYGVIVSYGMKRGLLLPNLDGVNDVQQQVDIAKSKAGITNQETAVIERFEVVRHQ